MRRGGGLRLWRGGGGYKTGPRQNNLDPDKAGNLCGIPHIATIYDDNNDDESSN